MISQKEEYKKLVYQRLEENWKSFNILYNLKHYGNCISIMRQELEQSINVLFLIKQNKIDKDKLIELAIANKRWSININKIKQYINDEVLQIFSESLDGWERGIYKFGFVFKSLSVNYNYMLRNPINSISEIERRTIHDYIKEYHVSNFRADFNIDDIIPVLPHIFEKLSGKLKESLMQL